MTYYIYTQENCPKCEDLKARLTLEGEHFVERDAARLKKPIDEIDREGLIEASMCNMELPIIVEWKGE